jgi:nucleolar protein 14
MTPEEKALERFVREKQRGNKKGSIFDLEDAEDDGQLTHFGQSLSFAAPKVDDFDEADSGVSDDEHEEIDGDRSHKRRRLSESDASDEGFSPTEDEVQPGRLKTKKEVMSEVIAKSKLHKYERQQAKEDDDDLRAELDKGLPDLFALMRGTPRQPAPIIVPANQSAKINPDRQALLDGKDRSQADKEYDERLRQMALDQRAKPTERTMTEEERLGQEAQRLKELEGNRLRRMRGEPDSGDEKTEEDAKGLSGDEDVDAEEEDTFGLGSGLLRQSENLELDVEDVDAEEEDTIRLGTGLMRQLEHLDLDVEDEDDFLIEDSLVASGSDVDLLEADEPKESAEGLREDEDDQEFVQGLLSKDDVGRAGLGISRSMDSKSNGSSSDLAYTYSCPQSHDELFEIATGIEIHDFPTVIQRIRALYHPKLHNDNKAKLAVFSSLLVDHLFLIATSRCYPPFSVLEMLIRHIHSLAKMFPEEIGRTFRSHLKSLHVSRPTAPNSGDLIILTAIASIFPTSDHFHQVVTPAILCMTRYLSQKIPQSLSDLATGAYLESLCLQYQRLSRRYIPELVNYTLNALLALAPVKAKRLYGCFPHHASLLPLQVDDIETISESHNRRLRFWDILPNPDASADETEDLKKALLDTNITMISSMADLWADKSAFSEVFDPFSRVLQHLLSKPCSLKLNNTTIVSTNLQPPIQIFTNYSLPVRRAHHPFPPLYSPPRFFPNPPASRPSQPPPPRHQNLHPQIRRFLQSL